MSRQYERKRLRATDGYAGIAERIQKDTVRWCALSADRIAGEGDEVMSVYCLAISVQAHC